MSAENQSALPDVRIAYHADGSATVNDVPVAAEPGQDVRDAAYQAAVGLVMAAGASGPVAATSVEADGTPYPLTLYPRKAVLAANALVNAAAIGAAGSAAPPAGEALDAGASDLDIGITSGIEGQYRRARRAWYRPTLSISWLVAAACACVMLSLLATVLLGQSNPSVVRLSVETENEVSHSAAAHITGRAMASLPDTAAKPTAKASAGKHPATPSASPLAHPSPNAAAADGTSGDGSNGSGSTSGYGVGGTSDGAAQPMKTVPAPAPGPKPKPTPSNSGPASVTNLAVTLAGGDKSDPSVAYVIALSTTNASPVTLTYTYDGYKGRAAVKRSIVLSGETSYAVADLIPAQPYCGGVLTMTASTTPVASNGSVTAVTQPGC